MDSEHDEILDSKNQIQNEHIPQAMTRVRGMIVDLVRIDIGKALIKIQPHNGFIGNIYQLMINDVVYKTVTQIKRMIS